MSAESPLDAPVGVDEQPVGEQHARPEAPATESLLETPQDQAGGSDARSISPLLPEIPGSDLELDLNSILNVGGATEPESEKVKKRASNVLKLSQENEKLKEELKALSDRLEAAERRRAQLANVDEQPPPSD
ncbi:hypothetical protein C8J57DRAFT_1286146 [Mycena rebaudengoi]|nr:hypothetical protein C8J57DRAFT_1286146 [Mycena rebaudengoi]